jgi:hypothetical protein
VRDSRLYPRIPTSVFPEAFFGMLVCRMGSFNELEQHRAKSSWRRRMGGHPLPSADELAYVSERINLEDLRRCQGRIYSRLKRNKILGPRHGWLLAAVDGHELGCSYHRCCPCCLQRELEVGGKPKVQYFHRIVAFTIIAEDFNFLLDLELQKPGEDEVAAAMRLIERVEQNHPRCFDVLCADAIYLRPSMLDWVRERGKHLIAVLKANQPELLREARTLMEPEQPQRLGLTTTKPGKTIELRDMEGFTTESIGEPLRVVWSREHCIGRERIAGQWEKKETLSDWFWATTMPQSLIAPWRVSDLGHDRWKIENEGFNELVTHWHANHYYRHHPNSIVALWLMLFMAHAVFHCFHRRNLKPALRANHTVIYFAALVAASLRADNWWPPPPT